MLKSKVIPVKDLNIGIKANAQIPPAIKELIINFKDLLR